MVHFFFKKWLEDNTNPDSHLTAVDIALSGNWCSNVAVLYDLWKYGSDCERPLYRNGLLRLFFGVNATRCYGDSHQLKDLEEKFFNELDDMMQSPVNKLLQDAVSSTFVDYVRQYYCDMRIKDHDFSGIRMQWIVEELASYYNKDVNIIRDTVQCYRKCNLVTIDKFKSGSTAYPYRCIKPETAVTFLVSESIAGNTLIDSTRVDTSDDLMRLVVALRCILMYKDDIWLSADKMFQDGHYYRSSDSDMVLLKHSLLVERVGLIHNCTRQ